MLEFPCTPGPPAAGQLNLDTCVVLCASTGEPVAAPCPGSDALNLVVFTRREAAIRFCSELPQGRHAVFTPFTKRIPEDAATRGLGVMVDPQHVGAELRWRSLRLVVDGLFSAGGGA